MPIDNMKTVSSYSSSASSSAQYDVVLRNYMLSIYNYMSIGIAVSGLTALFVSSIPSLMQVLFGTPLQYVVMFSPLVALLIMQFNIAKMDAAKLVTFFFGFSFLMGLSTSYIFIVYNMGSIARVFFITAGMFGSMSLYGYTTKKDLTGIGSMAMMIVFGLIIASIVNLFVKSSGFSMLISFLAVIVFTGLVAYDTQKLKRLYFQVQGHESIKKVAIMGALTLYLDFINIFIHLLHLMGARRD